MGKFRRELYESVRPEKAGFLIQSGTSKHVLDGPRWRRVSRGYYLPTGGPALTPTQRIVEAAARMPPGAVLGGWAAAYALGVDLLDGLDDYSMRPLSVPVCLPPSTHLAAVPGVRYVRQALERTEVRSLAGLPVTAPVRTALDLARWAPTVTEAVVSLDAMLQAKVVRLEQVSAMLPELAGRPGVRRARQAVGLSRIGVRSTWESRLRMLYVLDLGHASPLVNPPVFDGAGRFLGAPDLLDVEAGLAMEFDGARWTGSRPARGHRDRNQHREDNVREELFERAGLIVARADSGDLMRHRRQLLARLAAARLDGLARNRSRDRWTLRQPPHWLGMPA